MRKLLPILLLAALFQSCTSCPEYIKAYELKRCVNVVRVVELGAIEPMVAADSIRLLQREYETQLCSAIAEHRHIIDSLQAKIQKTEADINSTSSAQMVELLNKGIKSMRWKCNVAQQVIDTYQNSPEQTRLADILNQILHFQTDTAAVVAYKQKCVFVGRQGLLPKETYVRNYVLSFDRGEIVGELIQH
ncbi:MAG: hypothetical protein MJ069_01660 [Salinivirgaceae bacterium]|nr:hypothetical protein [Salinivirgaceae bacterium]